MKNILLVIIICIIITGCINEKENYNLNAFLTKDISLLYPGEEFKVKIEGEIEDISKTIFIEFNNERKKTYLGVEKAFTAPEHSTEMKIIVDNEIIKKTNVNISKIKTENLLYIYMAADNNMEIQALKDLEEIKEGTKNIKNLSVFIFIDMKESNLDNSYVIIENGNYRKIKQSTIEKNSGELDTIKDFINAGKKIYNSNKNFMVIWNHGDGWYNEKITNKRNVKKSIAIDDDSNDSLNLFELQEGLNTLGKKWDLLIFDACLMNTIEVAYQLKNVTEAIVGSPEEVPFDGYDYRKLIQHISANNTIEEISKQIIRESIDYYNKSKEFVCYSYLDLDQIDDFYLKIDRFAFNLIKKSEEIIVLKDKIKKEVLTYSVYKSDYSKYTSYLDLKSFLNLLVKNNIMTEQSNLLLSELKNIVKYELSTELTNNYNLEKSGGLSIYLPFENYYEEYESATNFGINNHWTDFIKILQNRD